MRRRSPLRLLAAWVFGAALVGSIAVPVGAQESLFALQFLGVSEETGDTRARGMGLLGVAIDDTRTAITLNPASLGALTHMTISAMGIAGVRTSREAGLEDRFGQARFPHQGFALPVFGHVVLSTGIVGLHNFKSQYELDAQSVEGLSYVQKFERSGNLYLIPAGVSRAIGDRVRVGLSVDFLLGTVDEAWTSSGDSLLSLRTRRRDRFTGRTVSLGVTVYPVSRLRLGASWSPSFDADRSARTTIEDARIVVGGATFRDTSTRADVRFPSVVRAGGLVDLGARWLVGFDVMRRDWDGYSGRLYGAESVGVETRVGAGVEARPHGGALQRLAYRLGLSRYVWPQRVGGETVNETALHLGSGLDFKQGLGRLDVAVEYARTGSLDRNGREESTWRFLMGISGQEIWQRKAR